MMSKLGEGGVHELDMKNFKDIKKKELQEQDGESISRFIILPDNYWNMQWGHLMQLVFIIWFFVTPILISHKGTIKVIDFRRLLVFDCIFMVDRFLDLFISFYTPAGQIEHRCYAVVLNNLSSKFFIEFAISLIPLYFHSGHDMASYSYASWKLARYQRLFEMDTHIQNYIESTAERKTVFELAQLEKSFDILKFILSTTCNMHIMSCTQILLCKSRGNYEKSWMFSKGIPEHDYKTQYITALYFVTTTLSTCGFGDISATRGDLLESLAILLLQFVGMLFYSMSIQKVQSYFVTDEISAPEFANAMQHLTEYLVVKVGRQMPIEKKIPGTVIKEWRQFTLKYFQTSPNAFLADDDRYQNMSCRMRA